MRTTAWLEQMGHFGEQTGRPDQIMEDVESRQRFNLKRTSAGHVAGSHGVVKRLRFRLGWHCMLTDLRARGSDAHENK